MAQANPIGPAPTIKLGSSSGDLAIRRSGDRCLVIWRSGHLTIAYISDQSPDRLLSGSPDKQSSDHQIARSPDARMILATWNVNSIRARLDRLLAFLARTRPDVVCLQEVKVAEEEFPHDALNAAGYLATVWGQRTYNGVAILARPVPVPGAAPTSPFGDVVRGFGDGRDDEARLLAATIGGVRVVSAYVPTERSWERQVAVTSWTGFRGSATGFPGSSRRSPLRHHGRLQHRRRKTVTSRDPRSGGSRCSHPDGRRALEAAVGSGLVDAVRLHDVGPGPFTWWDYRMLGFPKGNGLRIDDMFMTPILAGRCHRTTGSIERNGKANCLRSCAGTRGTRSGDLAIQ